MRKRQQKKNVKKRLVGSVLAIKSNVSFKILFRRRPVGKIPRFECSPEMAACFAGLKVSTMKKGLTYPPEFFQK